jgi:hypothetical protein
MSKGKWNGEDEVKSVINELIDGPCTASKIKQACTVCLKFVNEYKMVVFEVERIVKKGTNGDKPTGVYLIDAICRNSRSQFGSHRDLYTTRFSLRIKETLGSIDFTSLIPIERSSLYRIFNDWRKRDLFSSELVPYGINEMDSIGSPDSKNSPQQQYSPVYSNSKVSSSTSRQKTKLTNPSEKRKIAKVCPFRSGDSNNQCPFGEKCRFSHFEWSSSLSNLLGKKRNKTCDSDILILNKCNNNNNDNNKEIFLNLDDYYQDIIESNTIIPNIYDFIGLNQSQIATSLQQQQSTKLNQLNDDNNLINDNLELPKGERKYLPTIDNDIVYNLKGNENLKISILEKNLLKQLI